MPLPEEVVEAITDYGKCCADHYATVTQRLGAVKALERAVEREIVLARLDQHRSDCMKSHSGGSYICYVVRNLRAQAAALSGDKEEK